jgi:methylenetetrahydrofolate reductase (NADPH)
MTQQLQRRPQANTSVESIIMRLAREASVEINVHDLKDLEASRAFLRPGAKVFVTFLPKQTWEDSAAACRALRQAGLDPVPHLPVRQLEDAPMLERVLDALVRGGDVQEMLLLSGDRPDPAGPYSRVEEVLSTGVLNKFGLKRVSFAGHPEGHPRVPVEEIRRAERAKAFQAAHAGLDVSLMTQFFFEADPFVQWARELRAAGVQARIVAGLVGPTKLATLFKFALRCGAGPSIRALGARPTAFTKLLGDHGPQNVLHSLAEDLSAGAIDFDGVHMFGFGGYLRTCQWLHRVATGEFVLNVSGGFDVA